MNREIPHQNERIFTWTEGASPLWTRMKASTAWLPLNNTNKDDLQELLGVQEQAWPPDLLPQGRWPPKQKCKTLSLEDHQEELRTSSQITFKDTVIRPNETHNLILQWIKPFWFYFNPPTKGIMIFPPKIQDNITTYQATEYPHRIHSLVCCFFLCTSSCHLYFLQSSKCSIPPSSSSRETSWQLAQILFLIPLVRGPNSGLVLLYGFPSILPWRKPSCYGPLSKDTKHLPVSSPSG